MLLLTALNGEGSSLLLVSTLVCFCCQSGVSESYSSVLRVRNEKFKWIKTASDTVFYFNLSDRWTAADLGDGGGTEVSFSPSLPTMHPFSLALHNSQMPQCCQSNSWLDVLFQADFQIQRDTRNQI